jgi:ATP phosphoribosyltransferase regulatory subunit
VSKPFVFEKPAGMRDTLPPLYEIKRQTRQGMEEVIRRWGYQFIQTPTLEYYDTVGEASSILDQQLFKLLDQNGNTLVLRPDMTAPIARVASSSLHDQGYPLRLSYATSVFRAQQREGGRPAEFEQFGVELIGDRTTSADAEVIALMIETLKEAGLKEFQVAIGHVGFVNALFLEVLGNEQRSDSLRRFLYEKNYVGYRQHVKSLPLSSIDERRLLEFTQLRGGKENIERAKALISFSEGNKALEELTKLWEILEGYGVSEHISLDFTLISHMSYYTGIVFEGYGRNLGFPISSGGRYDELLGKFDQPAQATGFGIQLDHLVEALNSTVETPKTQCVIFSDERKLEAIERVQKMRKEGQHVVLQNLAGVQNVDVLSEKYDEVIYFIGKNEKEVYE